jgi:hypothetical protein
MTDETSSLKDDISFLRSLAEAGRRGPLNIGGAFLAAAGAIYGAAPLLNWVLIMRGEATPTAVAAVYWGAVVVFAVAFLCIGIAFRTHKPAATSTSGRAFGIAWWSAALGILASTTATAILASRMHDSALFLANATGGIAFYGAAWLVSSALTRRTWMQFIAIASYLCAIGFAFLPFGPSSLLVFSASVVLLTFVPGVYLMLYEAR